jgi:hypothetical protein
VVLILASAFLPGSPPKTSDSTTEMAKFIVDKGDELRIAGYLGAIAVVPFFWFLASLWRLLRRDEGGAPRLAVMAALGGAFAATVGAVGGIVLALLPMVRFSLDRDLLRVLYILATNIAFLALFGIATLVLSASVVFIRSRGMPVWLGYLGVVGWSRRVDRRRRDGVDERHAVHVRPHRLPAGVALARDPQHLHVGPGTRGRVAART